MKRCRSCKETKDESKFYKFNRHKDGLRHFCKKCMNAISVKNHKTDRMRESAYQRKSRLKNKYGLSLADYEARLSNQGRKCLICKISQDDVKRKFAVDHNHTTGEVRGLLCSSCNMGIGHLEDSAEMCRRAADYLEGSI